VKPGGRGYTPPFAEEPTMTTASTTPVADGPLTTRPQPTTSRLTAAYFSMEIGLDPNVPTYAGGLGILAGDSIRAGADLGINMVAVTLLHREGYFFQKLLPDGWQVEEPTQWTPSEHMTLLEPTVSVQIEDRTVQLRCWRFDVRGGSDHIVPVYLLDTDLPANSPADRLITQKLYVSDPAGRLIQEAVLGIGGVRMLRALGHREIAHCHMNEGHAALLVLELLREEAAARKTSTTDPLVLAAVRERGVFTTHTPVAAGHDKFDLELVRRVVEPTLLEPLDDPATRERFCEDNMLNLTFLGFGLSKYINGVARRHGEVSRALFDRFEIDSITNGIHTTTWVSKSFAELFDKRVPGWREDNATLRLVHGVALTEIRRAHRMAKRVLIELVNWRTNAGFDEETFTIGFARRATGYKRAELLLSDPNRLRHIARSVGRLQLVFAGKAHPNDGGGKEMIKRIVAAFGNLVPDIAAVYLPNYDMALAQALIPGVDLWLNTPQPPLEASGTSGMKAALNGVPSLSTLDGWWLEGHIENVTGWAIGRDSWTPAGSVDQHAGADAERNAADASSLYDKLEHTIMPMFYRDPEAFAAIMRSSIAINGAFFTTQRMMQQYVVRAYLA